MSRQSAGGDAFRCIRNILRPLPIVQPGLVPAFWKRKLRAVIFDVYGTLLSSSVGDVGVDGGTGGGEILASALVDGGWIQPHEEILFPDGLVENAIRAERRFMVEQGVAFPEIEIRRIWQKLLSGMGFATGDEEAKSKIALTAISYECRINPVWPMPNLMKLFDQLSGAGTEGGILSNAQFYTPILMETLTGKTLDALGFHPQLRVWSYMENRGKPSRLLFRTMNQRLAALGIEPREVAYLGNDMKKDIIPAHDVGWCTILFAGDARSLKLYDQEPDISRGLPDMIITDLLQLLQILA